MLRRRKAKKGEGEEKKRKNKYNLNQGGVGGGRSLEFHRHHRGFEQSNLSSLSSLLNSSPLGGSLWF